MPEITWIGARARAGIEHHYKPIDKMLARSEYLVGAYSFADIAVYMTQLCAAIMGVPLPWSQPHATAWRGSHAGPRPRAAGDGGDGKLHGRAGIAAA